MPETVPKADNRRVLIIDDIQAIHDDFDKILRPVGPSKEEEALEELDDFIFNHDEEVATSKNDSIIDFEVSHALQGEEGIDLVRKSSSGGTPYTLAFVDMRMPPGIDGLETIKRIWQIDPRLQIVICSAYSDHTWQDIVTQLGRSDRLLILKKPFDNSEVYQMAATLSEKWNTEERTQELTKSLEEKVEDRTSSLNELNDQLKTLNADLETALHEAQCAARAKGRFLATMSHEIRTTLNGIMGASYMLNNSELPKAEKDFANIIQTSSESLMTIINDILDYSKFDSGQLELDSTSFSIKDLVDECATLLKPIYEKANSDFSLSISSQIPRRVIGDPTRLRQIFLNLLNNAFKFSKDATVEFRISCEKVENDLASLRFVFRDTGIGMDEETISRLFTAFMQADSSTTRKFGGTGLGLAICKLLADAMNAELAVESEPGKGSTFTLTLDLPIDTASNEEGSRAENESNRESTAPLELPNKLVLLVDDNQINCRLARQFLKRLGIPSDIATNGEEAVKMFQSKTYDLVFMDLQMPVLSGTEATAQIRELEHQKGPDLPRTPVIALTANAFSEVREECIESGMNDFLTKPIRMAELRSTLAKWLNPVNN